MLLFFGPYWNYKYLPPSIYMYKYIDGGAGPKFSKSQNLSVNIDSSNRNQKKLRPVHVFLSFGLCSHYFFLVSIETTNDWYIQLIFHMLCKKMLYFDIQHALSEISMIWICHRHCLKIELFEWAGTHPSNKIYSQLCKTRNRKLMCDFNRKE